ncbi:MAG: hypothetical protein II948_11275, partial [Synergistaceae bacterium]|nr:hypothetical protein [Synergistaceae bacterium]
MSVASPRAVKIINIIPAGLVHAFAINIRVVRLNIICHCFSISRILNFNGASELLDIMASIISGFAIPLREEHVIFFKN